ncbi:MAG: hypothetical protein QOJ41_2399 [Acidobacteriaceae bacterium]|jgi:hypothetical protein|nr:hypothetical protein [Acidobacteriaceae bacterium]
MSVCWSCEHVSWLLFRSAFFWLHGDRSKRSTGRPRARLVLFRPRLFRIKNASEGVQGPRHIRPRSFHYSTNPVDAAEDLQEGMSQADHVLLDFDHKEIVIGARRVKPPKLQGVSGGAIFTFPEKRSWARLSLLVRKIDAIPASLWAQESSISWRWSVN